MINMHWDDGMKIFQPLSGMLACPIEWPKCPVGRKCVSTLIHDILFQIFTHTCMRVHTHVYKHHTFYSGQNDLQTSLMIYINWDDGMKIFQPSSGRILRSLYTRKILSGGTYTCRVWVEGAFLLCN